MGLLRRCNRSADITEAFVRLVTPRGEYLDWGGGYGVLTRLLRDRGLEFHHYDPYTDNLFAPITQSSRIHGGWDTITLFEVLEHLEQPLVTLTELSQRTSLILCSTELLPSPAPKVRDWWYYSPELGQHITFHTETGLRLMAEKIGMRLFTNRRNLHVFSRDDSMPLIAKLILRKTRSAPSVAWLMRRIQSSTSLTESDARKAGSGGSQ